MPNVVIPYVPRVIWRDVIHPLIERERFSVIVCHRRFGKTVGAINHIIKSAWINKLRQPRYAYIAPYRTQAELISWNYLLQYTEPFIQYGLKMNKSRLFVTLPNGAEIFVAGADRPDALRGVYWDGVVLDEFAQIRPEVWGEIIRPSLADRQGWAMFVGTPKGQNSFYEMYQRGLRRENGWVSLLYRASESGVIPEPELEAMKADMTEIEVRQELECDFTASASDILITLDLVQAAQSKIYREDEILGAPKIIGVDVARFGDDRSVVQRRYGLAAMPPLVYKGLNNMELVDRLIHTINEFEPDAVFIDSGRGEGVIDRCRQLGYDVTEISFGGRPLQEGRYLNKRAEMWDLMRKWLTEGGSIPNAKEEHLPDLVNDLTLPTYSFSTAGKMQLESKERMKERVGRSPDIADALALTFAFPGGSAAFMRGGAANRQERMRAEINKKWERYSPVKKRGDL